MFSSILGGGLLGEVMDVLFYTRSGLPSTTVTVFFILWLAFTSGFHHIGVHCIIDDHNNTPMVK